MSKLKPDFEVRFDGEAVAYCIAPFLEDIVKKCAAGHSFTVTHFPTGEQANVELDPVMTTRAINKIGVQIADWATQLLGLRSEEGYAGTVAAPECPVVKVPENIVPMMLMPVKAPAPAAAPVAPAPAPVTVIETPVVAQVAAVIEAKSAPTPTPAVEPTVVVVTATTPEGQQTAVLTVQKKAEPAPSIATQQTATPTAPAIELQVGWVVRLKSGRVYCVQQVHNLSPGAIVLGTMPHFDGDFSYICGREDCQCANKQA